MRYAIFVVALVASGCAYHAPDAPTPMPTATPSTPTPATLQILGSTRGDRLTDITAIVLSSDGRGVRDVPVTFDTSAGSLSPETATTGDDGRARAILTAYGLVTISATAGDLHASADVLSALQPPTPAPTPPTPIPMPPTPDVPLTVTLLVTPGYAGSTTTFALAVSPAITRAVWSSGDGATATTTAATVSYVYQTAGTYTASVTVTDALGRTASSSAQVVIRAAPVVTQPPPRAPALFLSLTCVEAVHGSPTPCNITVQDETGANVTLQVTNVIWNWGDGGQDSAGKVIAQHAYAQAGTYTVIVSAIGPDGRTGTASATVAIK